MSLRSDANTERSRASRALLEVSEELQRLAKALTDGEPAKALLSQAAEMRVHRFFPALATLSRTAELEAAADAVEQSDARDAASLRRHRETYQSAVWLK